MAFKIGTTSISKSYLSSSQINKVYLGTNLIYTSTPSEGRLFVYNGPDSKFKELDVSTLTVINSSTSTITSSGGYGLGGYGSSRLFRKTYNTTAGAELDVNTLEVISSITFPVTANGIEGTYNRLFLGSSSIIYEIDPTTYSIIKTSDSIRTANGRDIGCTNSRLYGISDPPSSTAVLQEFDIISLVVIKSNSAPSGSDTNNVGIGGVNNTLFSSDITTAKIYELNIDTLSPIRNVTSSGIYSIGGTKTYYPSLGSNLFNIDNGFNYYPDSSYSAPVNTRNSSSYTINTYTNTYTNKGFTLDLLPNTVYRFEYTNTNNMQTEANIYRDEVGFTFATRANYWLSGNSTVGNGTCSYQFTTHATVGKTFIGVNTYGATGGAVITNIGVYRV